MLLAAYAPPGKALSIEVICFKPVKIPRPWPKPRGEVRGGAWLFDRADVSEGVLNCAESGSVGKERRQVRPGCGSDSLPHPCSISTFPAQMTLQQ